MRQISLTQGKVALVDDADYDILTQNKWSATRREHTWYARTNLKMGDRKYKTISMHRFLMNPMPSSEVDHINGDGLDNRRKNLRLCLRASNMANSRGHRGRRSLYKGVKRTSDGRRWCATIKVNQKTLWLGRFDTEQEAAISYDRAAAQYFGRFARLNLPLEYGRGR